MERVTLFTASVFALALGGCSVSAYPDRPVVEERRRPIVIDERPPVVVERDHPYVIHGRQVLIAEGHGKLDFNAPRSGLVTVVETRNGHVLLNQDVRRGDRVAFDPVQNKAWLNGHTILDHDINSKRDYSMYFEER